MPASDTVINNNGPDNEGVIKCLNDAKEDFGLFVVIQTVTN